MLQLNNKSKLIFLITDNTISYGTNTTLNHIIILDEVMEDMSINSVVQLMSRASRVGLSTHGNIYIGNLTLAKLQDMIYNEKAQSQEALKLEEIA